MKAVILAGGLGTRISEESHLRPKPMIEIGGMPIIWHIMKIYSAHGINDFIICAGYKSYVIKEYFSNLFMHSSDVFLDLGRNTVEYRNHNSVPWKIRIIDTGLDTQTGGRLKRIQKYIGDDTFCMTYGDGVSDLDIKALIKFHHSHGRYASVTAIQPPARFGAITFKGDLVTSFDEKPVGDGQWINGGFFVLEPAVFDLIEGDQAIWEHGPLKALAAEQELMAFRHQGFWSAMDTMRDRDNLEQLWASGRAPWKVWL